MKSLLIATTNPGKLGEIKYFLQGIPLELLSLSDIKITEKPEEDGKTFKENAIKKALFYARKSKLPSIADDGGIEIDILNGEPGVKSRRWVNGNEATDEEIINHTLKKLQKIPLTKRGAQLHTVLVLAFPDGKIFAEEGIIRGIIALKPSKAHTKGYPYRALFYLPKLKKYYSEKELTEEEYQRLSHRGQALRKLSKIIKSELL